MLTCASVLDVRRLRVLHAVSAHGSVTAAAAALGYSGPAVSQQLSMLEREVGMRLTERAGRGITLTPAADILVAHTNVLLAQLDAAEAEVAGLRDEVTGRVALAAFPSAAATILPPVWQALAHDAPHVQLDLCEMEPDESVGALLRGETDIALAHEYDLIPRPLGQLLERRELLSDPVLIAVAADSVFAGDHRVALGDLADEPFLVPRVGTTCAEMTQRACAQAGFVPRVVAQATDFHVLLNLVSVGAGVVLVPQLAARHLPGNVCLLEPATSITRSIFAVSRRGGDRKPAVRVVLDELTAGAVALSSTADPAEASRNDP
jgi:DNA-binding transcriptional LysR family regulator